MKLFTGIWFNSSDDNQSKTHDKKEKKMVVQKPHGTMEYTVSVIGVAWMTVIIPVLGKHTVST